MKMRGEVLVELSPGLACLSVVESGRVGEALSARVAVRAGEGFAAGLASLRDPLEKLVVQAGVAGWSARVMYSSPDAAVGVFSCPKRAGRTAAQQAATLALGDSASLDLSQQPHAMLTLLTDSNAVEGTAQVHTLGIASNDAELSELEKLIVGVNLRFAGATPAAGVGMLSAVGQAQRAASKRGSEGVAIVLHLGNHDATIVGVSGDRLRFVRQAPIGVESLVEALARESISDVNGTAHKLDRDAARMIVMKHGIPVGGQGVEIAPGVMSTAVLPVLQSTLQRLVVDAKQSSRFGLTEEERSRATLSLGGVGAAIPRLGAVVSEQTWLKMAESSVTGSGANADHSAWAGAKELLLFPQSASRTYAVESLRRGLLIGATLAIVVVGLSWGKTRFDLYQMDTEIADLASPKVSGVGTQALAEEVRVAEAFLSTTRTALSNSVPTRVRAEGLMVALAEAAPKSLRLTSVELDSGEGNGTARIGGKIGAGIGQDSTLVVGRFIDAVSASPAVR